jgi:hypothetical protein
LATNRKCICGREYEVKQYKLAAPEADRFECQCGRDLLRWNGPQTFSVKLTKDIFFEELPDDPKSQDKPKPK